MERVIKQPKIFRETEIAVWVTFEADHKAVKAVREETEKAVS
jgi:hypothetical protein